MSNFNRNLRKYAELILKNGVNLQKGQELSISIGTNQTADFIGIVWCFKTARPDSALSVGNGHKTEILQIERSVCLLEPG